jgi:uncharacterized protein
MVIVDTGFSLALGNVKDKHHARAVKVLAGVREPLVTTWPVLTETCHLLLQRRGESAQRRFLPGYAQDAFYIHEIGVEQIPRILHLLAAGLAARLSGADACRDRARRGRLTRFGWSIRGRLDEMTGSLAALVRQCASAETGSGRCRSSRDSAPAVSRLCGRSAPWCRGAWARRRARCATERPSRGSKGGAEAGLASDASRAVA